MLISGEAGVVPNDGDVDLVLITVQLFAAEATRRIDAAKPDNCDF